MPTVYPNGKFAVTNYKNTLLIIGPRVHEYSITANGWVERQERPRYPVVSAVLDLGEYPK